ncbi:Metallo-dependent phosphatase [Suhomyces tanzawaensis NRRL Y-17324]|uniref:Metallo-dependent phosphatase n=1 Tax=Suhomyces tanzawaensis NRRL Y-17324 TaxID=984487 RepID=A0A1E4SFN7_9ASCO|nr:Metallo-dependent phosphatase [Suhomyces tanzawaensis NRRL Y-17324]ODV78327.1 Metallo-dependent phosphatase [Suhomyces tanzawaensis NRRL Y-17324]
MSESTPLIYKDDYEEFSLSKRAKIILSTAGVIVAAATLWLLCVFLPGKFIPEAVPLEAISKVSELGVRLEPLTRTRVEELGLGDWSGVAGAIDQDESEDSEDDDNYAEQLTSRPSKEVPGVERLIMIGDIHGHYSEFMKLLKKLHYNPSKDHVLVLGDFITKGPDSKKVLDFLIENDIDCIMGNHELYVLRYYAQYHSLRAPFFHDNETGTFTSMAMSNSGFNDDPEFLLAKRLVPDQVKYINKCSIIKTLGKVPLHKTKNEGGPRSTEGVAVHAGLRWDLELNDQDPIENLEMRSYIGPFYNKTTDDPFEDNAVSWSKIFNMKQKEKESEDTLAVYYGHDARRSLSLKKFTKGIDTGCDKGEYLTAMVLWNEIGENKKGKKRVLYKEQSVQIKC